MCAINVNRDPMCPEDLLIMNNPFSKGLTGWYATLPEFNRKLGGAWVAQSNKHCPPIHATLK